MSSQAFEQARSDELQRKNERIATLEVTLKDMDKLEGERLAHIVTLKARVKELETDWAEAIDIIKISGVAPKFVEKHK